ncbi:MAG: DUF2948 family protein [Pseudorhodobacter sp.]|nr:DUF2948 family protein [Pseudorhodobacter sp.]
MADARFAEGADTPLYLAAQDGDDLVVISTLVQDAVFPAGAMTWHHRKRQFALLLNRFRWEDRAAADRGARPYERVQSVLSVAEVQAVQTSGFDRRLRKTALSLLQVGWQPGADGTGQVILTLAGGGAVALKVEALDVTLRDVTRPYLAPSRHSPEHRT